MCTFPEASGFAVAAFTQNLRVYGSHLLKKRAFLHRFLLTLTIITACNLIFFSRSMRAFTMNPAVNEITSTAIGELRITVVYDNNPYKVGLHHGVLPVSLRERKKSSSLTRAVTAMCCSTTCSSWEFILKKSMS
jgi:hypothetical protein